MRSDRHDPEPPQFLERWNPLRSTAFALALFALPAGAQIEVGDNDFKISSTANQAGIRDADSAAVAHNPIDG